MKKLLEKPLEGFKILNKDMRAEFGDNMQYELNKKYKLDRPNDIEICIYGYHFCLDIFSVLSIYNIPGIRLFKTISTGYIVYDEDDDDSITFKKYAASEIVLTEEITDINGLIRQELKKIVDKDKYLNKFKLLMDFHELDLDIFLENLEILSFNDILYYLKRRQDGDAIDAITAFNILKSKISSDKFSREFAKFINNTLEDYLHEIYKELPIEILTENLDFIISNNMMIDVANDYIRNKILENKIILKDYYHIKKLLSCITDDEIDKYFVQYLNYLNELPRNRDSINISDEILIKYYDVFRKLKSNTLIRMLNSKSYEIIKLFENDIKNWDDFVLFFNPIYIRDNFYTTSMNSLELKNTAKFNLIYNHLSLRTKISFIKQYQWIDDEFLIKHWNDKAIDWDYIIRKTGHKIIPGTLALYITSLSSVIKISPQLRKKIIRDKMNKKPSVSRRKLKHYNLYCKRYYSSPMISYSVVTPIF